jgi:hypothetical protein
LHHDTVGFRLETLVLAGVVIAQLWSDFGVVGSRYLAKSRYCHAADDLPISEFLIVGWQHGSLDWFG